MTYEPRSLAVLQRLFYTHIVNTNSQLTDASPGSLLYTLARATAAMYNEQDLLLYEQGVEAFLSTATSTALDALASNFGLSRRAGTPAKGYVLGSVLTNNATLGTTALFTEPTTTLQFQLDLSRVNTAANSISLTQFAETAIPIQSLTTTSQANLLAGTQLIVPELLTGYFVVGTHRTSAGEVCGHLTGGAEPEADDAFRERIRQTLTARTASTEDALVSTLLSDPQIQGVSIKTDIPGLMEVSVETETPLTPTQEALVLERINSVKAAGVITLLKQPTKQLADVDVLLQAVAGTDLTSLNTNVLAAVKNYVNSLKEGATLAVAALAERVQAVSGVVAVKVMTPAADLRALSNDHVIRTGKVTVRYESN